MQLRSVIVTAPEQLRHELRGSAAPTRAHLTSLPSRLCCAHSHDVCRPATAEAAELEAEIHLHVHALAPRLLDEPGVGPIVAAPIPASSGQTSRHRLNRGGDHQSNRALHTVALHRRLHDPATKDYIARRVAEGKTTRDAVRLPKRHLARRLYRVLQNQAPLMT